MANRFLSDGKYEKNLSYCSVCVHKHFGVRSCKAFPAGIPEEFLSGELQHISKYPGDGGTQFEPIKNKKAASVVTK